MKPTVTKLKVLFDNQQPLEIVRPSETTIESLKYILRDQFAVQPELQMLNYKNPINQTFRYLVQKNQRIGDIGDEEQIVLELQQVQKRPFGFNSMNTKVTNLVVKSTNPKSVRRIRPGLILHSKCINPKCDAFGRSTRVNLGFGSFNIGRQIIRCVCPLCKQKSEKARNLGYYECRIRIEGQKVDQEEEMEPMDLVADDGMSHSFKDNGDEDFAQWQFIQVVTSEL